METAKECLNTIPGPKTLCDLVRKGIEMRKSFLTDYPNLKTLPAKQQQELWNQYCDLPTPLVPSEENRCREASCLVCRDGGWIISRDQKAIPCPNCSQWEEKKKQWLLEQSGIPEAKRICNLMSFIVRAGTEEAFKAVYELASGQASYKFLLIYGAVGCGKTHLAYAAGLEAKERGLGVRFYHVGELLSELRKLMNSAGQSPETLLDELKACDFLILDDLGANLGTDWQMAMIEELINYRYSHELPLIVTSNKDQTKLPAPILSRFKDARLSKRVLNSASDYRGQKK